jgi:hypothetical protein
MAADGGSAMVAGIFGAVDFVLDFWILNNETNLSPRCPFQTCTVVDCFLSWSNRSIFTMNHDTPDGSRLPPKELIQHGWKRTWNDEATAGRTGIGGRTTTNGRTSSSSKRARFNILEQFGSISVRDDDMDNHDRVVDTSFSSLCATDNGKYNGNGSSMVDGFSTENDDDDEDDDVEGDDYQSSSGPEDDDDDDELLSDEELLRRRLEKHVYVCSIGVEYIFSLFAFVHFVRSHPAAAFTSWPWGGAPPSMLRPRIRWSADLPRSSCNA